MGGTSTVVKSTRFELFDILKTINSKDISANKYKTAQNILFNYLNKGEKRFSFFIDL